MGFGRRGGRGVVGVRRRPAAAGRGRLPESRRGARDPEHGRHARHARPPILRAARRERPRLRHVPPAGGCDGAVSGHDTRAWDATQGTDPLFAAVDGRNCPHLPAWDPAASVPAADCLRLPAAASRREHEIPDASQFRRRAVHREERPARDPRSRDGPADDHEQDGRGARDDVEGASAGRGTRAPRAAGRPRRRRARAQRPTRLSRRARGSHAGTRCSCSARSSSATRCT